MSKITGELQWAGHWPIRIPDPETLRCSVAANTLKEALASLSAVNESLDGDVLARALADPEHEDIVRAVIVQSTEIARKLQRGLAC